MSTKRIASCRRPGKNGDHNKEVGQYDCPAALVDFVAELGRVSELHLLPYHRLGTGKHASLGTKPPFDVTESVSGDLLGWAIAKAAEKGLRAQVGG